VVPLLKELLGRDPGLTVGVEIFSEELKALPPSVVAQRVATATRGVLRQALGG